MSVSAPQASLSWVALLLADASPCLRWLTFRELLGRDQSDPEVRELSALRREDPLVRDLISPQEPDGSWKTIDSLSRRGVIPTTSLALARLGYLGFDSAFPSVRRGAGYLFERQLDDGSWPLPVDREDTESREGYSMMPLQTALPLHGLASCGYATDPRAERAYAWLLDQRLPDGAWPTGLAAGNPGYVAGYRRIAHSRWGCRSNTTGSLTCFALHPTRRHSVETRRALDLLLGCETRERHSLGHDIARLIGADRARGFLTYFARSDPARVLDLCWRIGAAADDPRVSEIVSFVLGLTGPHGLWTYGPAPQASRWITFGLLRSLSGLDASTDWVSTEPRTPFRAYPSIPKRF